jgi:L,D-transpeptidase ErfK/SrfK
MLSKRMNKWLTVWALCLASVSTGAWATVYELQADSSAVVGTDSRIKVSYQDTLLAVARRYGLGYPEIVRANPGVDIWLPGEEREILLPGRRILPPTSHEGIVVNLPEHRLYYYPKPTRGEKRVVITYPVSIGRMDWYSPLGQTWIIAKERHPNWAIHWDFAREALEAATGIPTVVGLQAHLDPASAFSTPRARAAFPATWLTAR